MNLLSFLLPIAINIVKRYIDSSDSKRDDEILKVVQDSCVYLCAKDNNSLDLVTSKVISEIKMKRK